jgi:hypothetical protein
MIWLLRRDNVNSSLTDDAIRGIARRGLGNEMQEWCENCNMFTLQIVVAYDLKAASPNQNQQQKGIDHEH